MNSFIEEKLSKPSPRATIHQAFGICLNSKNKGDDDPLKNVTKRKVFPSNADDFKSKLSSDENFTKDYQAKREFQTDSTLFWFLSSIEVLL